jgi:hypothetical protein
VQIALPFGYREVVPFLKTQKVRFMAARDVPAFAQRGNAVPISYTEFQLVAREYPSRSRGATVHGKGHDRQRRAGEAPHLRRERS